MSSVQRAGERIEELLASLRSQSGAAADAAEELVRLLVGLYGDGLGHIVAAMAAGGETGQAMTRSRPASGSKRCSPSWPRTPARRSPPPPKNW